MPLLSRSSQFSHTDFTFALILPRGGWEDEDEATCRKCKGNEFPPSSLPFVFSFCFLWWLNDEGCFYFRRHALKPRLESALPFDGEKWFNKTRGRKVNFRTCFAENYLHSITHRKSHINGKFITQEIVIKADLLSSENFVFLRRLIQIQLTRFRVDT